MNSPSTQSLRKSKCLPCEGGVPAIDPEAAAEYLRATPEWTLGEQGKVIFRKLNCQHFAAAIKLINQIADLAEREGHHPDLHLTGYRHLQIDLTTHAIGGLSENDFIVAAKIDELL